MSDKRVHFLEGGFEKLSVARADAEGPQGRFFWLCQYA